MLGKRFTLFHLSLTPRQPDLFVRFEGTREDWLRQSLQDPFELASPTGPLHWVPLQSDSEVIIGLIQRTRRHIRHKSPEEGGAEVSDAEWQGAYLLLDPRSHDDGQKAAVERDLVGRPTALLKALVESVNLRPAAPYHINVEPLFDGERFWHFSAKHLNKLRWITFEFVVPNMWDVANDLEEDLKETGKETGAQRVTVSFQSQDGVSTDTKKIKEGVSYVERGSGSLKAKSLTGERFNSADTSRTTIVDVPVEETTTRLDFLRQLTGRILGRESR